MDFEKQKERAVDEVLKNEDAIEETVKNEDGNESEIPGEKKKRADGEEDATKTKWHADEENMKGNHGEKSRSMGQIDVMKKCEQEKFGMKNVEVVEIVEQADSIKGAKDERTARWGEREPIGKAVIIMLEERRGCEVGTVCGENPSGKEECPVAEGPDEG